MRAWPRYACWQEESGETKVLSLGSPERGPLTLGLPVATRHCHLPSTRWEYAGAATQSPPEAGWSTGHASGTQMHCPGSRWSWGEFVVYLGCLQNRVFRFPVRSLQARCRESESSPKGTSLVPALVSPHNAAGGAHAPGCGSCSPPHRPALLRSRLPGAWPPCGRGSFARDAQENHPAGSLCPAHTPGLPQAWEAGFVKAAQGTDALRADELKAGTVTGGCQGRSEIREVLSTCPGRPAPQPVLEALGGVHAIWPLLLPPL